VDADIAWTGHEFLVLSLRGMETTLYRLDSSGNVLASAAVPSNMNVGRLAWSVEHDAGVVLVDSAIYAIDGAGNVAASLELPGETDGVEVMVTPRGFLGVRATQAVRSPGTRPEEMSYASLAPGQTAATWTVFEDGGAFWLAHAVDTRGLATSFAFHAFAEDGPSVRYDIVDGALTNRQTFAVPPSTGGGVVNAIANTTDRTLVVYGSEQLGAPSQAINQMWLMDPASLASPRQVNPTVNWADGAFVQVGADLVLLSGSIGVDQQLSAALVDPSLPEHPLGPLMVLGGDGNLSEAGKAVPIPRGFAVAWSERVISGASFHDDVLVQIFDCCVTTQP
jgi:hypothetical protein